MPLPVRRWSGLWARVLGRDVDPTAITLGTWTRAIDDRTSGAVDARGRRVPDKKRQPRRARTVAKSAKWLVYTLDWAAVWAVGNGRTLIARNPLRSRRFRDAIPKERNPKRPVASRDRYEALRAVSDDVTMELRHRGKREVARSFLSELLDLAVGTGRRISAICRLRYGDLQLADGTPFGSIRWRAENDKTGRETTVPINANARRAVDRILRERPGVGEAWMFPAPGNPERPIVYHLASRWLEEAETLAGLESQDGSLWHAFRRLWATERKHFAPQDVAEAGGWATVSMVTEIYSRADTDTTLAVVLGGGELRQSRGG